MRRKLLAVGYALFLIASLALVFAVPTNASCSTAYGTVDDGSGHYFNVGSGGTCAAPWLYWFDMGGTPAPNGCVGTFNIAHSDWNDCVNRVKFTGFPRGTILRVYRDANFGGASVGFGCQNTWYNLGNYNMADQASSLKTVAGTGSCT